MSIRKHGKFYRLDLWVRGKRIRRSLGTDEYYLALDRARDITAKLREPPPAGTPIAAFLEQYRAWAKETKPSSYRTEDYRLKVISAWLNNAGLLTLEVITPYHVEQMRAALRVHDRRAKDDGPFKDKEATKATVNRYMSLLRTVLNKAREWGLLKNENVFTHIKFYRESPEVRPLSDADVAAVMAASRTIAASPQSDVQRLLPDLLTLAFNTGLRRSELVAVRWRDVQGEDLAVRGKGNKRRLIPLNATALETIMRQPREGEFVFSIRNRHQPDLFRRTVWRVRKLSGVEDFHLHLTRHKFGSDLIRAGADFISVSSILGHSHAMTTLLYAHASADSKRRAVDAICDLRPPIPPTPAHHTGKAKKTPPARSGGA